MKYYDVDQQPFIARNFIDKGTCETLLNFMKEKGDEYYQPSPVEYWSNRTIPCYRIKEKSIQNTLKDVQRRVTNIVKGLSVIPDDLYADTIDMVRWQEGTELPAHVDNANLDGTPNVSPHRKFSTILYLNDDFEGGELYWVRLKRELKPERGMLAIFPADAYFLHGVKTITQGTRYTISMFYSYNSRMNILNYF